MKKIYGSILSANKVTQRNLRCEMVTVGAAPGVGCLWALGGTPVTWGWQHWSTGPSPRSPGPRGGQRCSEGNTVPPLCVCLPAPVLIGDWLAVDHSDTDLVE